MTIQEFQQRGEQCNNDRSDFHSFRCSNLDEEFKSARKVFGREINEIRNKLNKRSSIFDRASFSRTEHRAEESSFLPPPPPRINSRIKLNEASTRSREFEKVLRWSTYHRIEGERNWWTCKWTTVWKSGYEVILFVSRKKVEGTILLSVIFKVRWNCAIEYFYHCYVIRTLSQFVAFRNRAILFVPSKRKRR